MANIDLDIVLKPAVKQLELLRTNELSVTELIEAHIQQIERLNPELNAFADFDAERVRTQARTLDAVKGPRGALHGLPVTVKSSIATAGCRCEIGSQIHKGEVPREDAATVERLRAAGAVILGTTNCPEFLMAYETDNLLYGRTSNPWDLHRSAGGSSGGEAAAIAAGLSAGGLGSDGGGSVRVPAHYTGICALKPTPGRISGRGHLPPCAGPFSILGVIGPMARTIADVSLLFRTVAGYDPLDPVSPPVALHEPDRDELLANTIGFFEDDELVPVTAETRAAVQSAVQALRGAGFRVEPFRPRTLESLRKLWWMFFVQCGAMLYEPEIFGKRYQLSPIFEEFLGIAEASGKLTAAELLGAWAELDVLRAKTLQELEEYPVLLCPAAAMPAFGHGERSWTIEGKTVEYLDVMRYSQWFNAMAMPGAVVPVAQSSDGLPIGVQIAARPFADETVLGIANVVDEAFGYRTPALAQAETTVRN